MIRPNEVKKKALGLESQTIKFRSFLKNRADYDELDAQFKALHDEIFENYDCSKCANCCKTFGIVINDEDTKRMADFLGMTEVDFCKHYLTWTDDDDDDGEKQRIFKSEPCQFLDDDGRCRIQEVKPEICRAFPHTDNPDRLMSMYSVIASAEICPVVFEILERLKVIYHFRNRN